MKENTVTQEMIDGLIYDSKISAGTLWDKTTYVSVKLPNGFVITETSSCVDPKNYDYNLGYEICMERIKNKLWELEGYKLASKIYDEDPMRELDDVEHFIE